MFGLEWQLVEVLQPLYLLAIVLRFLVLFFSSDLIARVSATTQVALIG